MIALALPNGERIRVLNATSSEGSFGFHTQFGFLNREAAEARSRQRKAKGLKTSGEWLAEFKREKNEWLAIKGCEIQQQTEHTWSLLTDFGTFIIEEIESALIPAQPAPASERGVVESDFLHIEKRALEKSLLLSVLVLIFVYLVLPKTAPEVVAPPVMEPLEVTMKEEVQKSVTLTDAALMPEKIIKDASAKAKVAVAQNLGFLALSGRKDLTKALGGIQSVPQASAGAGAGGNQGSGGELLIGLGKGVERTTVGNSGVAGLGGIGTKGAGGGAGGYGTSLVGSGNGKALSSIPLSDDMVLDGGLDRSVIQATIAKYLNQVRACYEAGLRKSPGLVGQVTMGFVIGGTGAVSTAQVSKSSLGNSEVEGCISQKMLSWVFPSPRGGVSVKVHYPFLLRPVDS